MLRAHFILFVSDQARSEDFYRAVLGRSPTLSVPGMTEFTLPGGAVLGLMPETGIERLLAPEVLGLAALRGRPRAEVYLLVEEPERHLLLVPGEGGRIISPLAPRDWGDEAGYALDPDGHLLVFARRAGLGD